MPIFEYQCNTCGKQFQTLVMGGEEPTCKHCGAVDLKKLISVFAVGADDGGGFGGGDMDCGGGCGTCGDPRGPGACSFDD